MKGETSLELRVDRRDYQCKGQLRKYQLGVPVNFNSHTTADDHCALAASSGDSHIKITSSERLSVIYIA